LQDFFINSLKLFCYDTIDVRPVKKSQKFQLEKYTLINIKNTL